MQKDPCGLLLAAKLDQLPNQLARPLIQCWPSEGHGAAQTGAGRDTHPHLLTTPLGSVAPRCGLSQPLRDVWANAQSAEAHGRPPALTCRDPTCTLPEQSDPDHTCSTVSFPCVSKTLNQLDQGTFLRETALGSRVSGSANHARSQAGTASQKDREASARQPSSAGLSS